MEVLPFKIADEVENAHLLNDDAAEVAEVVKDDKLEVEDNDAESKDDKKEEKEDEVEEPLDNKKTYTAEEVSRAIAKRVARVKQASIKAEVEKITKAAEENVKALQAELAEAKRTNECYTLASETGVKYALLKATRLSGKDLEEYVEVYLKETASSGDKEIPENVKNYREVVKGKTKPETPFSFNDLY